MEDKGAPGNKSNVNKVPLTVDQINTDQITQVLNGKSVASQNTLTSLL